MMYEVEISLTMQVHTFNRDDIKKEALKKFKKEVAKAGRENTLDKVATVLIIKQVK